jgi:hypothetical protein
VNFADPALFVGYGSDLFAQDEMRVAEHPALGALREALQARAEPTMTVERGQPTPVLITGVERRCRVATDPNPADGRPHGLYGNAFARADADAIRRAATRIEPPTITNLIAMAAPSGGRGPYRGDTVGHILTNAFTGFRAARLETARDPAVGPRVVVHTGFWGCGAFGGNRVLMAMLQVIAAGLAALDRLVFYTVEPAGTRAIEQGLTHLRDLAGEGPIALSALIGGIVELGFEWGVSDGT